MAEENLHRRSISAAVFHKVQDGSPKSSNPPWTVAKGTVAGANNKTHYWTTGDTIEFYPIAQFPFVKDNAKTAPQAFRVFTTPRNNIAAVNTNGDDAQTRQ